MVCVGNQSKAQAVESGLYACALWWLCALQLLQGVHPRLLRPRVGHHRTHYIHARAFSEWHECGGFAVA